MFEDCIDIKKLKGDKYFKIDKGWKNIIHTYFLLQINIPHIIIRWFVIVIRILEFEFDPD